MGSRRGAGITGPLESYVAGFAAELARQGYTTGSAAKQLSLMRELSRWLASERLDADAFTAGVVDRFVAARRGTRTRDLSAKALIPLYDYLRELGVVTTFPTTPVVSPVEELLQRYGRYLTVERGLTAGTSQGYVDAARPFLASRVGGHRLELGDLNAGDVTRFVVSVCPGRAPGPAKLIVTALRSFLGFLHLEGLICEPLSAAVPAVASWRLTGLPRPLEPDQVAQMLTSCDRSTAVGRRDFAILTMLSRLGLRSGEVAGMGLDDIDWRVGEITVKGKGPAVERLPLPVDVGDALVDYLRNGRPVTAQGRTVFVRVLAPHRALTSGGVTQVVFAAGQRVGLGSVFAHRLRHSAATAMLRGGSSLAEVGQVLRHRRQLTTRIYAKVDHEALRSLARPWPGKTQ